MGLSRFLSEVLLLPGVHICSSSFLLLSRSAWRKEMRRRGGSWCPLTFEIRQQGPTRRRRSPQPCSGWNAHEQVPELILKWALWLLNGCITDSNFLQLTINRLYFHKTTPTALKFTNEDVHIPTTTQANLAHPRIRNNLKGGDPTLPNPAPPFNFPGLGKTQYMNYYFFFILIQTSAPRIKSFGLNGNKPLPTENSRTHFCTEKAQNSAQRSSLKKRNKKVSGKQKC